MTAQEFCYWLQGWLEMDERTIRDGGFVLTDSQMKTLRAHLGLVFNKVTPTYPAHPTGVAKGWVDSVTIPTNPKLDPFCAVSSPICFHWNDGPPASC